MGPELLLIPPANRVGGGCCPEETGRSTSRSAFGQVVGLLNTYLPLAVIVFVIYVKWFTVWPTTCWQRQVFAIDDESQNVPRSIMKLFGSPVLG